MTWCRVCEDVGSGKVSGEELDRAVEDTKAAIAELREAGLEKEAEKLETMLGKMEAGRAAAKAAASAVAVEEDMRAAGAKLPPPSFNR